MSYDRSEARQMPLKWMVLRQDDHGIWNLAAVALDEVGADVMLKRFEQNPSHKQLYEKCSYTSETYAATLRRYGINR